MIWKLLSLLFILFLAACATTHKVAQKTNDLNGSWSLAVFMPAQKKTLAEVLGERKVELQFDKATHGVSGTTGCNRFAGTYTADTVNLSFSQNHILTKMACGTYNEQVVLNALNQVNRYRLVEGQLELMQNNDILMIFAKKQQD